MEILVTNYNLGFRDHKKNVGSWFLQKAWILQYKIENDVQLQLSISCDGLPLSFNLSENAMYKFCSLSDKLGTFLLKVKKNEVLGEECVSPNSGELTNLNWGNLSPSRPLKDKSLNRTITKFAK